MTADLDTVVNRVRKLMALTAERGASEAEAALAAEHVQRLLAEHNLSMAAVEASGASSGAGDQRVREEGVGSKQVYKWQRTLMAAVAELNFCRSLERFQNRYNERTCSVSNVFDGYDLIGRVDNVTTTRHMFEYLLQTIERLARDDVGGDPTQFFTRYAHSFKEGCAGRLVSRLQDKLAEIVAEQERKAKDDAVRSQHPGAAKSNLPAVILSDVIQAEKDFNNDLEHDYEPGTTARYRAEQEAKRAAHRAAVEKRAIELRAAGIPDDVAYYMLIGYDERRARELCAPVEPKPRKEETEAQRRKREQSDEKWRDRQDRREQREASRLDWSGYRKGSAAGESVSLHRQVDRGSDKRRLT